ncbi:DUF111 family protein [Aminithiophilus ramosus]|uniref:DUF111 family protein n=1 Tax=Aminithiophilus ramosus TaxID=3029084 RepID=A0A9Q7AR02_9BACT|nr:nickel insertion protein [Aminithiophilus ramosus]QTX32436.1 DUF111 family protein [Aminithiophilus ramosus]
MILFEPHAGADGTRLLGALVDLGGDLSRLLPLRGFRAFGVEALSLRAERGREGPGATGLVVEVREKGSWLRRDMAEALDRASDLVGASSAVRERALRALALLLEAERVLGGGETLSVETGSFRTVVDLLGFFLLLDGLGEGPFLSMPLAVGSGAASGPGGLVLSPSPLVVETARLGALPLRGGPPSARVSTTAAALLASAERFIESFPSGVPLRVGYGVGDRAADAVRAILFRGGSLEEAHLVEASLDDATGEEMGRFLEELQALSLEAHLLQALGKKGRPLFILRALARSDQVEAVRAFFLERTPTLGVRSWPVRKDQMDRRWEVRTALVDGKAYPLRVKISRLGTVVKEKVEDDDVRRLPLP